MPRLTAGIDSLSQLEEFYCSNRGSPLTDLSPFAAHYNLKRLAVQEVDNLTGAAFESLSALKRMEHMAFTSIDSIEFLQHFPKLTYFLIARSQVTDFTPIAQLEFLESIYIYGQDASSISDFSIVRGMPNLWRLAIAGTAVTKLNDIAHLPALRVVGLDSNMISDISGIKPLSDLESLDLRGNQIQIVGDTFENWVSGTNVLLENNPLKCSEVPKLEAYTGINVSLGSECSNDIEDFSFDSDTRPYVVYHYALDDQLFDFPYDLNGSEYQVVTQGWSSGMSFDVEVDGTVQTFAVPFDTQAINDAWQSGMGTARMSTTSDYLGGKTSFRVVGGEKEARIVISTSAGLSVDEIVQSNQYLRITRTLEGTGNWGIQNSCTYPTMDGFSEQVDREIQIGLFFSDLITGGEGPVFEHSLAENALVNCADTPPGVYPLQVAALDGRGGKRLFDLTVEVLEAKVDGGLLEWFPAYDTDGDGVPNTEDVFPEDAAASLDTDGDGMPDDWNSDATPDQIAASGLTVDTDDDNDGVLDVFDHFPLDATQQYVPLSEAIAGIVDPILRQCVSDLAVDMVSVAEFSDLGQSEPGHCADGVASLAGLELFTHLTHITLMNGSISDLSPLAVLTDLCWLELSANNVTSG